MSEFKKIKVRDLRKMIKDLDLKKKILLFEDTVIKKKDKLLKY